MTNVLGVGQLTLTDLNDAIVSGTPPVNPTNGSLWVDESETPKLLKKWNGSTWDTIGEILDDGTAQTIEDIQETLGNMANDNLITFDERQVVKDKVTEIIGYVMSDGTTNLPASSTLDSSNRGGYYAVRKSALNAGIQSNDSLYVNVATQYDNLKNYLNGLSPRPWDLSTSNKDNNTSVTKSTFRDKWLQYYKSVDELATATAQKLKENVDNIQIGGRNLVKNSSKEYQTVSVGNYNVQANEGNLELLSYYNINAGDTITYRVYIKNEGEYKVATRTSYYLASGTYSSEIGNYIDAGEEGFSQLTLTIPTDREKIWFGFQNGNSGNNTPVTIKYKELKVEKGNKATDYSPAPEDIEERVTYVESKVTEDSIYDAVTGHSGYIASQQAITEAIATAKSTADTAKTNAQTANNSISDLANDNKLTPVEKHTLKKEWDIIKSEKTDLENMGNLTGVTLEKTTYVNAYNDLDNFITPLLSNLAITSSTTGTTLRLKFKTYYDARTALLNKVANLTNDKIDNLKIGATNLLPNSSGEIVSDEESTTPDGWGTFNSTTGTVDVDAGRITGNSVRIYATATGGGFSTPTAYGIKPNTEYVFSGWMKSEVACNLGWLLKFQDSAGVQSNPLSSISVPCLANEWTYIEQKFTTSSDTVSILNTPRLISGASPTTSAPIAVWADDLKLEEGNRATSWSESPLDNASQFSFVSTKVSEVYQLIGDGKIVSSVTQTEEFESLMNMKADSDDLAGYATTEELENRDTQVANNIKSAISSIDLSPFVKGEDLEQTVNAIIGKFSMSGGVNLLKNSVGFSGTDFWTATGYVETVQSLELDSVGAKSAFFLKNGTISQKVQINEKYPYTISAIVKKGSAGTGYLKISDSNTTQTYTINANQSYDFELIQITMKPVSKEITIEINGDTASNGVTFTSIMLNIGDVALQWSTSTGEFYNTNVQMDINGIKVIQIDNNIATGFTVMTPEKFAGYFDVNQDGVIDETKNSPDEVFRMDRDEFVMKKMVAKEEMTMGSIKVIKINSGGNNGWAFVATE
ncbi:hypothetical protein Q7A53_06225 [Halobacillus rhizosphaerae]|uniref:hypothetical protein n=1 Tax=Halobacillus rhizosphaerae TaxID=3064889 RepID=UPI00398AADDA